MQRCCCLILLVFFHATWAAAEDWPRWRGVRGDGTWKGPSLHTDWSEHKPAERWSVEIGPGYSGVTVVAGRVYTMDRQTEPREVERLLCFEAGSGRLLWVQETPVAYGDLSYGTGPRAAPTVHAGLVYSQGALGHLQCRDAATGKLLWSKHLQKDFGGRLSEWGYAAAPVVLGGKLFVQPGGKGAAIVALDPRTGEEIWRSLSDQAGYTPPILVTHAGQQQLIWWSPSHFRGLDPKTGKPLWEVPYEIQYGVSIATPIVHRGIALIAGYWDGSRAVKLAAEPTKSTLLWKETRLLRGLMSQPLARDGYVYLLDKSYGLTCFEIETGKKIWDDDNKMTPRGRNPQASLVALAGTSRALVLNSAGDLILAELTPRGYRELARKNIIGETWAHPACAGRFVYARSDKELVCVALPVEDE